MVFKQKKTKAAKFSLDDQRKNDASIFVTFVTFCSKFR